MGYCQFLRDLFEEGRVVVLEIASVSDEELSRGDELIAEYERVHRLGMPGTAPDFVAAAGRWAGTRFFRACQFAVYRDIDAEKLNDELSLPIGEPISADVHYSVDLVFRYLPELAKFAASAAERDPLLEHLHRWATEWPLSSVGMSGIEEVAIDGFIGNPNLMQLYADRIIASGDKTRLSNDAVRRVVQGALGMYPDLAREISTALLNETNGTTSDE